MEPALNPADEQILAQVADAIRARDTTRAAALAEGALKSGLRHPLLFNARALWLGEQGRHKAALAEFRRAEEMSPPNAAILNAITTCFIKLEQPAEAIETIDRAIALQPSAVLYCRKGWVHEMAQEPGEARRAHERAIELQPDYAEPIGRLAYLAARRGDWSEARHLAERSLALDGRQTTAHLALAEADIEDGLFDAAQVRLNLLVTNQAVRGVDRYLALGLLGDLRDRQGRVNEAFELYQKANRQFDAHHVSRQSAGAPTIRDSVSALIAYMEKAEPTPRINRIPGDATSHIFLLGFPRSGTTLLEQVLASHPDVVTLEERDTLGDAVRAFMAQPSDLGNLFAAGDTELAPYRELYWQRVRKFGIQPHGKILVDKTPINTVKLGVIGRIFPQAKIIFAIRDPRDVVLSCFRRQFDMNVSTSEFVTLDRTARFYDAVMRLGELYCTKLSLDPCRVRHEDLVGDFEAQVQKFCEAIGLSWNESMRDFAAGMKTRSVGTPSAAQLARGLNSEGIGQWRRYETHLGAILPVLRPWVKRFGYSRQ